MKNKLVVKPVNFLGDTLMAAQDAEGNIWAGVKWIAWQNGNSFSKADRRS